VYKGIHASSTVFWRLSALTSIGVRPVRLIPLPCQPPKDGTWGPEEFCATDLRFCKALEWSVLDVRWTTVTQQNRKSVVRNRVSPCTLRVS